MTSEERLQQARASVAQLNMPTKKDTDCQYFIQSGCSRGEQCGFRHQEMAKKNTVCIPWMQSKCTKGMQCFFQHPSLLDSYNSYGASYGVGYSSLPVGAVDRSTTPCYYFKNGTCHKGAKCSFLHPGGETPAGLNSANAPNNNMQGSTGGGAFGGGGFGPAPGLYPPPASFGSTGRGPTPTFGKSGFNAHPVSSLGSSNGNAGFALSTFARSPFSNPQHMPPPRGMAQASASDRRTETYPSEASSTVKDKLGFASTNTRLDPKANLRPKLDRGVERERERERTVGVKHERELNRTNPLHVPANRPERVRSVHPTRASAIHGVGLFSRGISEALGMGIARQAPPLRQPTTTRHTPSIAAPTAPTLTRKVQSTGGAISITTPMRRSQESQKQQQQQQSTAELAEKGIKRVVEGSVRPLRNYAGVESGGAVETKLRSTAKPQSLQKQVEGAVPRFGKAAAARAKQLLDEANKGEEEMESSSSAPKQQVKAAPQPEKRKAEPASGSPLVRSVSKSDGPAEMTTPVVKKFDGPKTFEQIMEEKRKRKVEAPPPGAPEAATSVPTPPEKKPKASPVPAQVPPKTGPAASKYATPAKKAAPAVVTKQRSPGTQSTGMAPIAPIGVPGNPTSTAAAAEGKERTEEAAADYNAEEDEFDAGDEGLEDEDEQEEAEEVEDGMDDDIAEALAFDF